MIRNSYEDYTFYYDLNICEDALNIGWAGKDYFDPAETSIEIINILKRFIPFRVRSLRTLVHCPICGKIPESMKINDKEYNMGFSEIRVLSSEGQVFAIPDLVFHYISHHNYCLPSQFLDELQTSWAPESKQYQNYRIRFEEEYCWGKNKEEMICINELMNHLYSSDYEKLTEVFKQDPHAVNTCVVGGSLVNLAVEQNDPQMVQFLLDRRFDKPRFGGVELYNTVDNDNYDIAKLLVDAGFAMNTKCPEMNPLYAAIDCENLEMVRLLVEHGLDINIHYDDEDDYDAFEHARNCGADEISKYLSNFKR